jgi:protein tyrosine/serine phosphatase
VTVDRHLDWDGCFNVRDLGGLLAADGRPIRRGAVVRGDSAQRLTAAGWSALLAHGIRTVVDLRDPDEYVADAAPRSADLTTVQLPLEDRTDEAFWERWRRLSGTPLYYQAFLERWPERFAAVFAAIAEAAPGGVLVHCAAGRDRTGLVTLLLLALVGVSHEEIAADYALSIDRLRIRSAHEGRADEDVAAQEHLRQASTSTRAAILATLAALDVPAYLRDGGLRPDQEAAIRARLFATPNDDALVVP